MSDFGMHDAMMLDTFAGLLAKRDILQFKKKYLKQFQAQENALE